MAEATAIEWCDSTFNGWWGCTKIAPACDFCYAADLDKRYGGDHWGNVQRRRTSTQNWNEPRRWQRKAAEFFEEHGRRRRVFCGSMKDCFDNQVPDEWRADLWALIRDCHDLDWLMLTKRPQNIAKMLPGFWDDVRGHVWLGTTVEDQDRADQNIPQLLKHDSAVRFISAEPLLGPIYIPEYMPNPLWDGLPSWKQPEINWVIAGGESGPHARPSHPDWFRSLRDQCEAGGVPFLFKQWGSFVPQYDDDIDARYWSAQPAEFDDSPVDEGWCFGRRAGQRPWMMFRRDKKRAGRLLDGVEHNGFPEARAA